MKGDNNMKTETQSVANDAFNRLFDSDFTMKRYGLAASPLDIAVYDSVSGLSQLKYSPPLIPGVNTNSAVVCVAGSCRGNGTSSAAASYGVYFGPDSRWNLKGRLPSDIPQTSQVAELHSIEKALEIFEERLETKSSSDPALEIVIVSNSSYAVLGLTRDISTWLKNDFKNSRRKPVVRGTEFLQIHESLQRLAERNFEIRFWLDTGRKTRDAYLLARSVGRLPYQPIIETLTPELQYFIFDAVKNPLARRLASQLGFKLPRRKSKVSDKIIEVSQRNFELLFGPTWKGPSGQGTSNTSSSKIVQRSQDTREVP